MNGRCAKCNPSPTETSRSFVKPISYVAPVGQPPAGTTTQRTWKSPTLQDAIDIRRVREQSKRQTRFVTAAVLVVLAFVGYQIYHFFIEKALSYGGYYWNQPQGYAMTFPARGWGHYPDFRLSSLPVKDSQDAFYLGKNPDDPEILMTMWTVYNSQGYEGGLAPPEDALIKQAQDDLITHMNKSGYSCDITDWKKKIIGGNPGFLFYATAQRGSRSFKSLTYCTFNKHFSYTIHFLGSVDKIDQHENELNQLMDSFGFRSTLI